MALIIADRVMESSTSTGTGNFSLAGAYTGYRAFDDVCANGDTCYYCIEALDSNENPTGDWEVGLGTFNDTDTLARTTPTASSNGGAAVNFAAGSKRVSLQATAAYLGTLASASDLGAMELVGSYTPSGVTSLNIENFAGLTNKSQILIVIETLTVSSDGIGISARYKLNGSYKSDGLYQYYTARVWTPSTASNAASNTATSIEIVLAAGAGTGGMESGAGGGFSGSLRLLNPYDTTGYKRLSLEGCFNDDTATPRLCYLDGRASYRGTDGAGVLQGLQLSCSSGTFSATIHVYALKTA